MKKQKNNTPAAKKHPPRTVLNNGRLYFVDEYTENGKRKRRFFVSEAEMSAAKEARKIASNSIIKNIAKAEFTPELLLDIGNALKIIPEGLTLTQCVEMASKTFVPKKNFAECLEEFIGTKRNVTSNTRITVKSRIKRYFNSIGCDFKKVSTESLLGFISQVSDSEKTKKHYASILHEFFSWLEVREYFLNNPFKKIHRSDLPHPLPQKRDRIDISLVSEFFKECEACLPKYAGICALAAFGGVRINEAMRLKPENIDFGRKEIVIPFNISKTGKKSGKSYLQSDMPDNLWEWIEKFPIPKGTSEFYVDIRKLKTWKALPKNALRHCFATYHLSLYRSPSKTAMLMRHENESKLWNTYLDSLCGADIAEDYFKILPS